jgi:chaperonin cofactor prefoldin
MLTRIEVSNKIAQIRDLESRATALESQAGELREKIYKLQTEIMNEFPIAK